MKALFVELPAFSRHCANYLDDAAYSELQQFLLKNPETGDVIEGTGGLRKMRHGDARRGKGKRGGLRVIYYWWIGGAQFWLFAVYDKNEVADLSTDERRTLKTLLKRELDARSQK